MIYSLANSLASSFSLLLESLTDAWFKQKHKELLETEPDVDINIKL